MWLLIPFVALPIIEIALFIKVGGLIGLLPTLGLVILSAIAGSWLMRRQGMAALSDLQRSFTELRDPSGPLAHGALILLAGTLLVLPGFLTDAVGLLLLVPAVRRLVIARLARRVRVTHGGIRHAARDPWSDPRSWQRGGGAVIDADYVTVTEPRAPGGPGRPPSGWTRH